MLVRLGSQTILSLFVFSFWIWVLQPIKIISLILSQVNVQVGWKREITKKNHLTIHKQTWLVSHVTSKAQTHISEMMSDLER